MNRDLELLIAFLRPIESLLLDNSVSEIMGNPDGSWWYERAGKLCRADSVTFDAKSLNTGLEVIANRLGRKLDAAHPILNVQLPDGSMTSISFSSLGTARAWDTRRQTAT